MKKPNVNKFFDNGDGNLQFDDNEVSEDQTLSSEEIDTDVDTTVNTGRKVRVHKNPGAVKAVLVNLDEAIHMAFKDLAKSGKYGAKNPTALARNLIQDFVKQNS